MGRWFARFLREEGKEVIITGRDERKLLEAKQELGVEVASNEEAVRQADTVLLSVPIDSFEEVVKQLGPGIRPGQTVIDITSVKAPTVETMHRYISAGLVLGVHPMFGPGARGIKNQSFVLTPTNDGEQAFAQKVEKYLRERRARVTIMTPQEHDDLMAVILGLSHFIGIVSADTLVSFERLKQMEAIGGSTFRMLLTLAGSVLSEDAEFYASLQMSLPNMPEVEHLFQKSVKTWADLVKSKDKKEFIERMNLLKNRLDKDNLDFRKTYENMYRIVEGC